MCYLALFGNHFSRRKTLNSNQLYYVPKSALYHSLLVVVVVGLGKYIQILRFKMNNTFSAFLFEKKLKRKFISIIRLISL